jgi:tRNA(fMet)-specific endonuclease VapC
VTRVCLDTSAYSRFRRGHERVTRIIDDARSVLVPAVVLGELRAGFRFGRSADENEHHLRAFLAHPLVSVIPIGDEVASVYAELWVDLRQRGTPVPTNDLWIAATAVVEGASVLTFDAHFRSIPRVGALVLE